MFEGISLLRVEGGRVEKDLDLNLLTPSSQALLKLYLGYSSYPMIRDALKPKAEDRHHQSCHLKQLETWVRL